jgi:hypothetical protein
MLDAYIRRVRTSMTPDELSRDKTYRRIVDMIPEQLAVAN